MILPKYGRILNAMLAELFGSKVRAKLLSVFVANPHDRYYLSQIQRVAGVRGGQLQTELARLTDLGVLRRSRDGNRVYYQVNERWPLLPEFRTIVLKSTGVEALLGRDLDASEDVRAAFIYGSYASGKEDAASDIDLLVVGDITDRALHERVAHVERTLHRQINYVLYSPGEFRRRVRSRSGFLRNVLSGPKIFVKGDERALRALGE